MSGAKLRPVNGASKYLVFIVSGGRTGTQFFGDLLSEIVPGSFSVHEPDMLDWPSKKTWEKIKTFGWYHMVFGRLLGKTGIRNLAQRYIAGRIELADAVEDLHRQRDRYYASISSDYIVESYYQWFGLLPAIPKAYTNHRIVAVIRDPRTWVTSWMNIRPLYGPRDWVTRLGFQRIHPEMMGDSEYAQRWSSMSVFEKNCWRWKATYTLIADGISDNPNARMFRFEDLFLAEDRGNQLRHMLDFITRFSDREFPYALDGNVLKTPRNVAPGLGFADWPNWDMRLAKQLNSICFPLMERFGYGLETEWLELTGERSRIPP